VVGYFRLASASTCRHFIRKVTRGGGGLWRVTGRVEMVLVFLLIRLYFIFITAEKARKGARAERGFKS